MVVLHVSSLTKQVSSRVKGESLSKASYTEGVDIS